MWPDMSLRRNQALKKLMADIFFAVTLVLVVTSDKLGIFFEQLLRTDHGDNPFSNLLDSHQWLRTAFNIALTELWASVLAFFWDFGYWTCKQLFKHGVANPNLIYLSTKFIQNTSSLIFCVPMTEAGSRFYHSFAAFNKAPYDQKVVGSFFCKLFLFLFVKPNFTFIFFQHPENRWPLSRGPTHCCLLVSSSFPC